METRSNGLTIKHMSSMRFKGFQKNFKRFKEVSNGLQQFLVAIATLGTSNVHPSVCLSVCLSVYKLCKQLHISSLTPYSSL